MHNTLKKDIYRYYGRYKLTLKEKLLMNNELKLIMSYRKAQYYSKYPLLKYYYRIINKKNCAKCLCQIPYTTNIGEGFYIGHAMGIIINPKTIIGKNVNIAQGVTIGQENRGKRKGTPTIGDKVWIGANAVIVGKINIGNDVLIAPNAYVNFDVPNHSIVLGNPAKIIHKENATQEYINRTIEEVIK